MDMTQFFNFGDCPPHMHDGLEDYFMHGYRPGGFLNALLANDLHGAVTRADHINQSHLPVLVMWLANNAPPGSWGSYRQVNAWLEDTDGRRTEFSQRREKEVMWKKLAA
jgi:hypothetical protein